MTPAEKLTIELTVGGLAIAAAALIYAIKPYWLKMGISVRGWAGPASSIYTEDDWISKIYLENHKDRPVIIFGIYYKLGSNLYIELENFENDPLILKPFEAYSKLLDEPICHYINLKPIHITPIIKNTSIKKQLILSTHLGYCKVKPLTKIWSPEIDWCNNLATGIIQPIRLLHKGRSYGSNVKYLVDFAYADGSHETIQLQDGDYKFQCFKKLQLTPETLESKTMLENHIQQLVMSGDIKCDSFVVHDWIFAQTKYYPESKTQKIEIPVMGWFKYNIMSRIATILEHRRLRIHNIKNAASKNATSLAPTQDSEPPPAKESPESAKPGINPEGLTNRSTRTLPPQATSSTSHSDFSSPPAAPQSASPVNSNR